MTRPFFIYGTCTGRPLTCQLVTCNLSRVKFFHYLCVYENSDKYNIDRINLISFIHCCYYLIGEKISDVGNDMNNANAREACRYRAESVAYEFKKTEELQRLAREFFGKSESYREQDLFSLLKTMQQLDPKLSRTWFFRGTNDSLRLLERNSSELRKMKFPGLS